MFIWNMDGTRARLGDNESYLEIVTYISQNPSKNVLFLELVYE